MTLSEWQDVRSRVTEVLAPHLAKLPSAASSALVDDISHEIAAWEEMKRISSVSRQGHRGPKAKPGAVFLQQVNAALLKAGVRLRQWQGGKGTRNELIELAQELLRETGKRHIIFSARQASNALQSSPPTQPAQSQ